MDLSSRHQGFIDMLQRGDFVGPIREYYAKDVEVRTNNDAPAIGRDAVAEAEAAYVKGVTAFHGVEVHGTAIDDHGEGSGVVFYECTMRWEHMNRPAVHINQTVVERWDAGYIKSIRFFGDIEL